MHSYSELYLQSYHLGMHDRARHPASCANDHPSLHRSPGASYKPHLQGTVRMQGLTCRSMNLLRYNVNYGWPTAFAKSVSMCPMTKAGLKAVGSVRMRTSDTKITPQTKSHTRRQSFVLSILSPTFGVFFLSLAFNQATSFYSPLLINTRLIAVSATFSISANLRIKS